MIDIDVCDVSVEFEVGKKVLDGLTFQVNAGERVGLLGNNGAGKTTLFRILTGELAPDAGSAKTAPGKQVGLISQIPVYPEDFTVQDVLLTAFSHLDEIEHEMHALEKDMGDGDREKLRRYDELTAAYTAGGGYEKDTVFRKVTNGLAISPAMLSQNFAALSGGEKTRMNLARLLLLHTEILLLDEPTNHLDLHATEWLEEYLASYKGTVLAISHDRWFLDHVVRRCIEIKEGKAEFYAGNYSFYAEERERRFEEKLKQYEKEQSKIKQLQEAADKMRLWAFLGNDKLYKRAFSMEKRIERIQTTDRPQKNRTLKAGFHEWDFQGDEVLVTENLSMGFGERVLFRDVNLTVAPGERIALLGNNGTGKSTFLKLLLQEEKPIGGAIRCGPSVRIGYLPQLVSFEHPERTLVDTLIWDLNCTPGEARNRLAAFNFRGDEVFKEVRTLSGGEASRLRLCELMNEQINFLLLDEPTNHLDAESRGWVEGAVASYTGTLLFVSHDRYFIDRFAERIWTLRENRIEDFHGDYQTYVDRAKKRESVSPVSFTEGSPKEKPKRRSGIRELEKSLRDAERAVAKAEERQYDLSLKAEEVSSNYLELQKVYDEQKVLADEIDRLYAQWESLEAELKEEEEET